MAGELTGWTIAVIGGDRRMLEHIGQARAGRGGDGRCTRAGDAGRGRQRRPRDLGADPGARVDDSLYAPFAKEKLFTTTEVLRGAAPGAMMFMGRSSPRI
jgi:hypothetical protein